MRGSELAADLKLKLSLKQGVPARELCLIHQQETLDDRLSLRQQQVSPGSSVHLVLVAADNPGQATYVGPVTTPALSITHMNLGIGLEQLWTSPPLSSSQITRIPLPAHLQHLIQVYDVSSEVMTVLLVYLYSGELPATLPECELIMGLFNMQTDSQIASLFHTHTHTHTHTLSLSLSLPTHSRQ